MVGHPSDNDRQAGAIIGCHCAVMLCLLMFTIVGCATPVMHLSHRDQRENALAGLLRTNPASSLTQTLGLTSPPPSAQLSDRSWQVLHRYGLAEAYRKHGDCRPAMRVLRGRIATTRDPDLIYTAAELAYVQGKQDQSSGDRSEAMQQYGMALAGSYDYLFAEDLNTHRNPYDPQFRDACDVYNESLEDLLRMLCDGNQFKPGQTYTLRGRAGNTITLHTAIRGRWKSEEFEKYEFVSDYRIEKLRNRYTQFGLGVPLIAVRKPGIESDQREAYYPKGLSYAMTAMIRKTDGVKDALRQQIDPGTGASSSSHDGTAKATPADVTLTLEFFDPLATEQVLVSGQWVPLESDLTTPLAYFLDTPQFRSRNEANLGFFDPEESQKNRGLYMLEPFDPDRIPVVMVHGLWSSPQTWMDMFNDLRSFPEIRRRYQFWFYLYPSGQPFWLSATQMRHDLAAVRRLANSPSSSGSPGDRDGVTMELTDAGRLLIDDSVTPTDPLDQMVLVGHSMGGLVSRMQTIDSGDDFWDIFSDAPVDQLKGDREDREQLLSAMFFTPNPAVKRVITIGTPHRGSDFANDLTRWLAGKLISLPRMVTNTSNGLIRENPKLFKNTDLLVASNAVDSLDPGSPIFPVMLRARRAPWVRYHNIIGVLNDTSISQSVGAKVNSRMFDVSAGTDGIVAYASATMPDTESELTVNAEHTEIHTTSPAIYEVKRIL
ncbi:MAG: alpha/beta fold hydrolase, partial [Planctomycetota bacterium]